MIEKIHDNLVSELDRSTRSDIVFIISAVLFNILVMFVNWSLSSSLNHERGSILIFIIFLFGTLVVTGTALIALVNSKNICIRTHEALEKIYVTSNVSEFLPDGMVSFGKKRFILSFIVVAGTGLISVFVPIISLQNW